MTEVPTRRDSSCGKEPIARPRVPEGWLVYWDEKCKQFYYVNIATKQSQWELPTVPTVADPPAYDDIEAALEPPRGRRGYEDQRASARAYTTAVAQPNMLLQQSAQPLPGEAPRNRSRSLGDKISKLLRSRTSRFSSRLASGTPPWQYYGRISPQNGYYRQQQTINPYCENSYGTSAKIGPGGIVVGGVGVGLGAGLLGELLLNDAFEHHDQDIFQDGYQEEMMDNPFDGGDYDGGGCDF